MKVKKIFKAGLILALACGTLFSNPIQLKSYTANVAYATEETDKETEKEDENVTDGTVEKNKKALNGALDQIEKIQSEDTYDLATDKEKEKLEEVKEKIRTALAGVENLKEKDVSNLLSELKVAEESLSKTPMKDRVIDYSRPINALVNEYNNTLDKIKEYVDDNETFVKSALYNDVEKEYQKSYDDAITEAKEVVRKYVNNNIKLDDLIEKQIKANDILEKLNNSIEDIRLNAKTTKNLLKILNDQEKFEKSDFYKKASKKDKTAYQNLIKEVKEMYNKLVEDDEAYTKDQINDVIKKYNELIKKLKKDDDALEAKYKKLEEAVYKNEVQAEAARILLKKNPKSTASIKDELEDLIKESEALVERAKKILKEAGRL